jgi:hypothetical protein
MVIKTSGFFIFHIDNIGKSPIFNHLQTWDPFHANGVCLLFCYRRKWWAKKVFGILGILINPQNYTPKKIGVPVITALIPREI